MAGMHSVAKPAGVKDAQGYALFASILARVKSGERVYIKDFGTFWAVKRKARTITSPQIPGGTAEIPERMVLRFRPSPITRQVLNGKKGGKPKPTAKPAAKPAAKGAKVKQPAAPASDGSG
jgi:nucleoid DNA-binding protein